MRSLCVIFFFILSFTVKGQTFFYSYVDPCSGKSKELTIPYGQNNVTVNYYGNVNTFNANDFNSGVFQSWMQNIAQTNSSNPCSSVAVIVTNNINMMVTQNVVSTVMNITALTASLSGLSSDISSITGGGNMAAALDNSENGDGGSKDDNKNDTKPNGGSSTTSNGSGNNSQAQTNNGNSNGTAGGSTQTGGTSQQSSNTTSAGSTTTQPSVGSSSSNNTGTNGTSNTSTSGNSSTNNGSTSQSGNTTGGSTSNGASNNSGQSNGQPGSQTVNSSNTSTSTAPNSTSNGNINSNPSGTSTRSTNTTNNTTGSKTSSEESSGSGSGSTSAALTNAEEGSSGGGGGSKKDGGEKKTGSMIGQGDLVVMKSADDPAAKNQVKFNSSITKANTDNTRVKGILVNYTSVVNNTNITLYKAWVFKKSKLTMIAANSSMMNFEKDFFNTTTVVLSKRYKGTWRKLTTMAGLNFTAGNYGNTPFMNAAAVAGGFYAYKVNDKISGSLLVVGVYSPFTQFFDGKWWDSSTLIVPYSTWDYKLTKTFKLNVSFSGVYEMNKTMLNYQVLTGGKIMF